MNPYVSGVASLAFAFGVLAVGLGSWRGWHDVTVAGALLLLGGYVVVEAASRSII